MKTLRLVGPILVGGALVLGGITYLAQKSVTYLIAQDSVDPDEVNKRGQAVANRYEKVIGDLNEDYMAGKLKDNDLKVISFYAKEAMGLTSAAEAEYVFCSDDKVNSKCEQAMKHIGEANEALDMLAAFHKDAGTQQVQSKPSQSQPSDEEE